MLEFTVNYNINGSSYPVLDNNTTGVSYNLAGATLDTSVVIEDTTTNVDSILVYLTAGDPITVTVTYTNPSSTVECEVASVSNASSKVNAGVRTLSLSFEITTFTVT